MIIFDRATCRDLSTARHREWIETNGIGGYASSTIVGLNTRRYHGLLVAAIRPPPGRMVLLSKMEETILIGGHRYDLSTNRYAGATYPAGYELLKEFRLDPFPVFVYEVEGVEIEKRVFLIYGHNTVVIEYDFRGVDRGFSMDVSFEFRPVIAFRDYDSTTRWNDVLDPGFAIEGGRVTFTPYQGVPSLHIAFGKAQIERVRDWYYNFERDAERQRGSLQSASFEIRARGCIAQASSVAELLRVDQPATAAEAKAPLARGVGPKRPSLVG
jgi:predicted glycogen debranching enzyme